MGRLAGLDRAQRRLLAQAGAALARAQLRDWRLGYPRSMEILGPLGGGNGPEAPTAAPEPALPAIRWALRAWVRRAPWHVSCRVEALAAHRLLEAHGLEGETWIGVHRDEHGRLHSHAWLVVDGYVVTGGGPRGHQVIGVRRPPRGAS